MSHAQVHGKSKAKSKFIPQPLSDEMETEDMVAEDNNDTQWAAPMLEPDEESDMLEDATSYCAEHCGLHSSAEIKDWLEEESMTVSNWRFE